MYDVFLSYNNKDHSEVELVARALKERGLSVFLDRWYLAPGAPWPQRLEELLDECRAVAIFVGPHGMGGWQQREKYLSLDRQVHQPTFPVVPVLLPGADPALGFLSLNTWVDLRRAVDEPYALQVLAEAIRGNPPGSDLQQKVAEALADVCPYRGLRFFREEDAPFFFGRDSFIKDLSETVGKHKLTAVVGASGSGKSSVVRAGLIPLLRQSKSSVWGVITMVPGDQPLQGLAAALVPLLEPKMTEIDRLSEVKKLADRLATGEITLRSVVDRALEIELGTDNLLLLVDQWEELYTLTRDDQIKKRFLDELLDAMLSGRFSVIFTLRGDFYDKVLSHGPFTDQLLKAVVNVSPMKREELQQIIEGPAHKVGLQFEPGLVSRILDEVEGRPGNLPLLEFVLTELWREKRNGFLTHAAYDKMGEVEGAIASRAEVFFEALSAEEQEITRRIFLQLIQPSLHSQQTSQEITYTRRRTTFSEIGAGNEKVARKLADAHLVVTGRDNVTGEEIIDLVHEALIKAWGRLKGWVEKERDFLLWRERLRSLMVLWTESHDTGALLTGVFLRQAKDWSKSHSVELSQSEQSYIRRSGHYLWKWRIIAALGLLFSIAGSIYLFSNRRAANDAASVNSKLKAPTEAGDPDTDDQDVTDTDNPLAEPKAPDPIAPTTEIPFPAKYYKPADGRKNKYIVIHSAISKATVDALGTVVNLFHSQINTKASVHYLVGVDGKVVKMLDETKHTAFHVGHAGYKDDIRNDNTIAVELIGADTFTDVQVEALKNLLKSLVSKYRIDPDDIVGHNEISNEKATDPGPKLNLDQIREEARSWSQ